MVAKSLRRALMHCALALMPLVLLAASGAHTAEDFPKSASQADWSSYNGNTDETRYSLLNQINRDTVGRLGLAWSFDFDDSHAQEATPLVVDGVMYVTSSWSKLYALDAATGKLLWKFDPKVPGRFQLNACCDVISRGAAYADGRVFLATLDGRLIALDAKTGSPLWSVLTVDQSQPYTITGAPRVAKGKVFIGNGGAEYGVRGYIAAYDQASGKQVWRFYTVPGERGKKDGAASDDALARLAQDTWFGDDYWKLGGGGTVWDSIVYDAQLDQLIVGVGNGGPWDRKIRSQGKGDNLFLGSVLALDPDTGAYRWHYQETPGDSWDFTSTQQITLTTLTIAGKRRDVLVHAPKNGFLYVVDRTDGKLISADKFVPANWADHVDQATGRPVEAQDAHYMDKPFLATVGSTGGHNWHPMAYDPAQGLVFIPAQTIPEFYAHDDKFAVQKGLWALGIDVAYGGMPETTAQIAAAKKAMQGSLIAWNPVARKEVWRVTHGAAWNGGIVATAGGLVFQGLADGNLRAYDSSSGSQLWSFDAQNAIVAGGMTYEIAGTQYVAVTVGGSNGTPAMGRLDGPLAHPPGRVLVFRLDGTARLPALDTSIPPINAGSGTWSSAQLATGERIYGKICSACHAFATKSAGVFPDLKRSGALPSRDAWRQIVIGGALEDSGMVGFSRYISADEAEDVRGYVTILAKREMMK